MDIKLIAYKNLSVSSSTSIRKLDNRYASSFQELLSTESNKILVKDRLFDSQLEESHDRYQEIPPTIVDGVELKRSCMYAGKGPIYFPTADMPLEYQIDWHNRISNLSHPDDLFQFEPFAVLSGAYNTAYEIPESIFSEVMNSRIKQLGYEGVCKLCLNSNHRSVELSKLDPELGKSLAFKLRQLNFYESIVAKFKLHSESNLLDLQRT